LELYYKYNFTTAYVQAKHRQNTGYIFLSKEYKCIFSTIYTTTHKNKLESTQLKSFLPLFGLATRRRVI